MVQKKAAEGNVKAIWVPTIADTDKEPTTAEITAGTKLTPQLPTPGLDISWTQNNSSTNMLDESFTTESIGTESATINLTFVRDFDGSDTVADLFTRGLRGFLVISRDGTPGAGDVVEVYPCEAHRPVPLRPATNEDQQFSVKLAVNDTPNLEAVVGA